MTKADAIFSGSIPALYDTCMGPLIFEPYADDIAARLAAFAPGRVLETAAGTGIVTRRLIRSLPVDASVVATDLNQPMLEHAAKMLVSDRVGWQTADAQALPFGDGEFDAVVCQFGVMFFPDRLKAYRQALRVLRPGGRFVFNAWDTIETNEFADVVTTALANMFPDDPPLFLARTPHGYHRKDVIINETRRAGFKDVTLDTVTLRSVAPSPRDPAIGYCQGTPLRNEIVSRSADRLSEATEAAANAIRARFGDGPVDGQIQAHVIVATR